METWYLLFGGISPDGRGSGKYVGRTTDVRIAYEHYLLLKDDPYSTGSVFIVTDTEHKRATRSDFV